MTSLRGNPRWPWPAGLAIVALVLLLALPGSAGALSTPYAAPAAPTSPAPAMQAASSPVAASTGSLSVSTLFSGLNFSVLTNAVVPPDPVVATGPAAVMELVNTRVGVWSRDGAVRLDTAMYAFFRLSPSDFLSDPKVLYDAPTGRWFATVDDLTRSSVEVAVSAGTDPMGSWSFQEFHSGAACPDQPLLGLSAFVVMLSVNDFSGCTMNATFLGAELFVINKADLLAGHAASFSRLGPYLALASVYPVDSLDAGAPAYFVTVGLGDVPTNLLKLFTVQGVPPSAVSLSESDLAIRTVLEPPNAPQPGTSLQVNTGDARTLDAFLSGTSLWMTFANACAAPVTGANHSCVRILKVSTSGPTVLQDFDAANTSLFYFYPAIRRDAQGDLVVVFGASSASVDPSLEAAIQLSTDPANTLRPPIPIANGTGYETLYCPDTVSCRYGDYFGAAVDPLDPSQVWVAGELGTGRGWDTAIAGVGVYPLVNLTASYSLSGNATGFPGVALTYFAAGLPRTLALSTIPATVAVDVDSTWSVPASVPGPGGETRFAAAGPSNGTAPSATTVAVAYGVQYLVTAWNGGLGGTVSGASGWYAPGASVSFVATAEAGWRFLGWQGRGNASYTGLQNPAALTVMGPANETAVFGAGITLSAGPGGSIAYAFGNTSGTVAAGTTEVIYVPAGASLSLTAVPEGLNQFNGWSGGLAGSRATITLVVLAPMTVSAGFTSWLVILALFVGVPLAAVLVFVIAYVMIRRRQVAAAPPSQAPPAVPPSEPGPPPAEPPRPRP